MSRPAIDETGKVFGRWTVVARAERDGKGARWIVRCECGREGSVRGSHLRLGMSTQCAPCAWTRHSVDISGQTFGRWTVVGHTSGSGWTCRCACGNERVISAYELTNGRTHGCFPCSTRDRLVVLEVGQRFGRLVVVENVGVSQGKSKSMARFRCDCGRVVRLASAMVTSGNNSTCGGCRIKCARCGQKVRRIVHCTSKHPDRCVPCGLLAKTNARRKAPLGRVCAWCRRTDSEAHWSGSPNECGACNRQACRRGRDAEGRPIARGVRKVVAT